jgi:hypothetical protein
VVVEVSKRLEAQPTLTAALADKGTAEIIGEAEGGWFWLPPLGAVADLGRHKDLRVLKKGWP